MKDCPRASKDEKEKPVKRVSRTAQARWALNVEHAEQLTSELRPWRQFRSNHGDRSPSRSFRPVMVDTVDAVVHGDYGADHAALSKSH